MKFSKIFALNLIGFVLIILGFIRVFQLLFFGVSAHIFWLCNFILIILGIAVLFRNSFVLMGGFCFLFFGQLFWIVGFLLYFVFDISLSGSSAYLLYESIFINLSSILVHFLTLPLSLIAIFILGKKEKFAWVSGLLIALFILPFVLYFGEAYNLNCFFKPCFSLIPEFRFYSLLMIPLYFLIFVIPLNLFLNFLLDKFSFLKNN